MRSNEMKYLNDDAFQADAGLINCDTFANFNTDESSLIDSEQVKHVCSEEHKNASQDEFDHYKHEN